MFLHPRQCSRGRVSGAAGDVCLLDHAEVTTRDRVALRDAGARQRIAEQQDVARGQGRHPATEIDELTASTRLGQQVCHAHPVERPVDHRLGRIEIGMRVEVQQGGRSPLTLPTRHGAELDGAVSADDQGHEALLERGRDLVCHGERSCANRLDVHCEWIGPIRPPAKPRRVAKVDDLYPHLA